MTASRHRPERDRRAGHRLVPQRRDLAGPARRVDRLAAERLPALRSRDPGAGQRPGPLLAAAARTVPRLRRPDLVAIPARRARHRRAVRGCRVVRRGVLDPARAALPGGHHRGARADRHRHAAAAGRDRAAVVPRRRSCCWRSPAGTPAATSDWAAFVRALIGGAAMFAVYFVLLLVYPAGMGFGDVKLAGVLGLYLGWFGWASLVVGWFARLPARRNLRRRLSWWPAGRAGSRVSRSDLGCCSVRSWESARPPGRGLVPSGCSEPVTSAWIRECSSRAMRTR